MKKVIFSAIAMMVFVGSSMASEITDDKEVISILLKNESQNVNGDPSGCATVASAGVMLAEEEYHKKTKNCFDEHIFNLLYTIYYNQCLE